MYAQTIQSAFGRRIVEGLSSAPEFWSEDACLGVGLPAEAEHELALAGQSYADTATAEGHLLKALASAPGHLAVEIGFYRFYFYKGRLEEALTVAKRCLHRAAIQLGIDPNWRAVRPEDANFDSYDALPRFYLFTLKAFAYLNLRLGNASDGSAAAFKLMSLDFRDRLNGSLLIAVHQRKDDDE